MPSIVQQYNNKDTRLTQNGKILNGEMIGDDGFTVFRFRDGYLDGDVLDVNGNLISVLPAIEGPGFQEFWRQNKLHRDNGPAIQSEGFTHKEWWKDGIQVE